MFEVYPILKFVHVAAVICWLGGGVLLSILAAQVRRDGSAEELAATLNRIEWFGKRYFSLLMIVTLIAGIGLVQIGWSFSAPWVGIGFLGLFISGAIGGGYLGRKAREIKALVAEGGAHSAPAQAAIGQFLVAARVDIVVLTLVVVDMVLKPGS